MTCKRTNVAVILRVEEMRVIRHAWLAYEKWSADESCLAVRSRHYLPIKAVCMVPAKTLKTPEMR